MTKKLSRNNRWISSDQVKVAQIVFLRKRCMAVMKIAVLSFVGSGRHVTDNVNLFAAFVPIPLSVSSGIIAVSVRRCVHFGCARARASLIGFRADVSCCVFIRFCPMADVTHCCWRLFSESASDLTIVEIGMDAPPVHRQHRWETRRQCQKKNGIEKENEKRRKKRRRIHVKHGDAKKMFVFRKYHYVFHVISFMRAACVVCIVFGMHIII